MQGEPREAGQLCSVYRPYTGASAVVPRYWVERYEREAAKNWELFYRRNRDRFFKDRHYLQAEWCELRSGSAEGAVGRAGGGEGAGEEAAEAVGVEHCEVPRCEEHEDALPPLAGGERLVLLEAGCGAGNTIFPLLRANPSLRVYAFDFSETAVQIVSGHPLSRGRVVAAVGDLTSGELPPALRGCRADVCTLMFVLSAIAPDKFGAAIAAVASGLREGGVVLFRDYGLGDCAQQRLELSRQAKRLHPEQPWMVRQDGTRAYYFGTDELRDLFDAAGLDTLDCAYAQRTTTNRAQGVNIERRFVTARFIKNSVGVRRGLPNILQL